MEETLKILMLEDMEEDAFLIQHELEKDGILFISECVDTREEFLDALDSFEPDVVLTDHALPQFNSIEALKICNERKLAIPFILITGTISEEFAVDCLKQGIDDYILKGNLARLPIAIKKALIQRATENRNREVEKSLRIRNEELTKANEELDNFVYSVSHNLRGPLATIRGLLNIAEVEKNMREFKPGIYIALIKKSVKALEKTIGQILDYSRNTRSETKYSSINIYPFISKLVEEFNYLPTFDRIRFKLDIDKEIDSITDVTRLAIILHNILANAIQYLNKEAYEITITVTKENSITVISIEDNGMGIEEYLMGNIFDMFFRGTDKSHGAGLGLYIAQDAARKIGGTITIKSIEKTGTTVTISFPDHPIS